MEKIEKAGNADFVHSQCHSADVFAGVPVTFLGDRGGQDRGGDHSAGYIHDQA